jgi:hypothetical protein
VCARASRFFSQWAVAKANVSCTPFPHNASSFAHFNRMIGPAAPGASFHIFTPDLHAPHFAPKFGAATNRRTYQIAQSANFRLLAICVRAASVCLRVFSAVCFAKRIMFVYNENETRAIKGYVRIWSSPVLVLFLVCSCSTQGAATSQEL